MSNVLSIVNYVNETLKESAESGKPSWAKSKREKNVLRYAVAYNENETWLNSIEVLFHRYGINNQTEISNEYV